MRIVGLIESIVPQEMAEELICPHCGKVCKSKAALKAHCKKEHAENLDETGGDLDA